MRRRVWIASIVAMAGSAATPVASTAAARPECKVDRQGPGMNTSYSSKKLADPLGAALADAAADDTLQVAGSCHGNFVIGKTLTLRGREGRGDSLDGDGSGIVLTIRGGATSADAIDVQIEHLRIADGEIGLARARREGASEAFSTVTLTDSTISDNSAQGIREASFVGEGSCRGELKLDHSAVRSNGGVGLHMGQGICGPYTLDHSRVNNNTGAGIFVGTSLLPFAGNVACTVRRSAATRPACRWGGAAA